MQDRKQRHKKAHKNRSLQVKESRSKKNEKKKQLHMLTPQNTHTHTRICLHKTNFCSALGDHRRPFCCKQRQRHTLTHFGTHLPTLPSETLSHSRMEKVESWTFLCFPSSKIVFSLCVEFTPAANGLSVPQIRKASNLFFFSSTQFIPFVKEIKNNTRG